MRKERMGLLGAGGVAGTQEDQEGVSSPWAWSCKGVASTDCQVPGLGVVSFGRARLCCPGLGEALERRGWWSPRGLACGPMGNGLEVLSVSELSCLIRQLIKAKALPADLSLWLICKPCLSFLCSSSVLEEYKNIMSTICAHNGV